MTLHGQCDDCGEMAPLRYKTEIPIGRQSRPSVCDFCRQEREIMMREQERRL